MIVFFFQNVQVLSSSMLTVTPQETSKSSMYYALQFLKNNLTDVVIQVRCLDLN